MTDISDIKYYSAMISKENGEIIKSLYIDENDHWKEELGDLCGLAIRPMLDKVGLTFDDACEIGIRRKRDKMSKLENCI